MNSVKSKGLVFFLTMVVSSSVYSQSSQVLSADEFEKEMNATEEKTILDVRTPGEFSAGHLANAKNIDYYRKDFIQQVSKLDKNKPVFVYCKGGGRSGSATEMLTGLGFTKIYDLEGGITFWKQDNKPVTK